MGCCGGCDAGTGCEGGCTGCAGDVYAGVGCAGGGGGVPAYVYPVPIPVPVPSPFLQGAVAGVLPITRTLRGSSIAAPSIPTSSCDPFDLACLQRFADAERRAGKTVVLPSEQAYWRYVGAMTRGHQSAIVDAFYGQYVQALAREGVTAMCAPRTLIDSNFMARPSCVPPQAPYTAPARVGPKVLRGTDLSRLPPPGGPALSPPSSPSREPSNEAVCRGVTSSMRGGVWTPECILMTEKGWQRYQSIAQSGPFGSLENWSAAINRFFGGSPMEMFTIPEGSRVMVRAGPFNRGSNRYYRVATYPSGVIGGREGYLLEDAIQRSGAIQRSASTGAIDLATLQSLAPVGQQLGGALRSLAEWWGANKAKIRAPRAAGPMAIAASAPAPEVTSAGNCPPGGCVLHELGALDDVTGQRTTALRVPDGAHVKLLGRATGTIQAGGVPVGPQEWFHVQATGTDGGTIEGWMLPENLLGVVASSQDAGVIRAGLGGLGDAYLDTGAASGQTARPITKTLRGSRIPAPLPIYPLNALNADLRWGRSSIPLTWVSCRGPVEVLGTNYGTINSQTALWARVQCRAADGTLHHGWLAPDRVPKGGQDAQAGLVAQGARAGQTGASPTDPGTITLADETEIDIASSSAVSAPTRIPKQAEWLAGAKVSRCFANGCRVWKKDLSGVLGVARSGTTALTQAAAPDGSTAVFDADDPSRGAFVYAVFEDSNEGWVNPLSFRSVTPDKPVVPYTIDPRVVVCGRGGCQVRVTAGGTVFKVLRPGTAMTIIARTKALGPSYYAQVRVGSETGWVHSSQFQAPGG